MTVIERLYDNAWYVANAAPGVREQLDADVTRAWMEREAAIENATRARSVGTVSTARSALALSLGTAIQAGYDRARARAAEAARCTDIVAGHAFTVQRQLASGGAMTISISSCTLLRRATISVVGRGELWAATFTDPQSVHATFSTTLGTDPWEAFHRACEWIVTGEL